MSGEFSDAELLRRIQRLETRVVQLESEARERFVRDTPNPGGSVEIPIHRVFPAIPGERKIIYLMSTTEGDGVTPAEMPYDTFWYSNPVLTRWIPMGGTYTNLQGLPGQASPAGQVF